MDFCAAIQGRKLVRFTYDGHPRVVIPAAFGNHATTGNLVLRGYQVGGSSSTRTPPLWDLFLVEKMVGVELEGGTFTDTPPDYRPGDKHIAPIQCEL